MSEENAEPKPAGPVKYTFDRASGQVHRQEPESDREHIATILAGTIIWADAEKRDRFRSVLSKKMKEWQVTANSEKVAGESGRPARNPDAPEVENDFPEESGKESGPANTDTEDFDEGEVASVSGPVGTPAQPPTDHFAGMSDDVKNAVMTLRSMKGYPQRVEDNAPPPPKRSSGAGDKTPEFVEWMLRYHPGRFARRYGIQGTGSIEKIDFELNPETRRRRRVRRREGGHIIARRKTHLTELADSYTRNEDRNES